MCSMPASTNTHDTGASWPAQRREGAALPARGMRTLIKATASPMRDAVYASQEVVKWCKRVDRRHGSRNIAPVVCHKAEERGIRGWATSRADRGAGWSLIWTPIDPVSCVSCVSWMCWLDAGETHSSSTVTSSSTSQPASLSSNPGTSSSSRPIPSRGCELRREDAGSRSGRRASECPVRDTRRRDSRRAPTRRAARRELMSIEDAEGYAEHWEPVLCGE
jgi:hypothetical protein